MKLRNQVIIGIIIGISLFSSVHAYVLESYKWPYNGSAFVVTYKWGDRLQGSGSLWRNAFETGIADWNAKAIKPDYSYSNSSSTIVNTYDMQDGNYGITFINTSGNSIISCTIQGNIRTNIGATSNAIRSTATHELGHCLALNHSNISDAIMRSGRDRNIIYQVKTDDINGINAQYP